MSSTGVQANSDSWSPAVSGDGRFVVFSSLASNLVPGDSNGVADIFLHDRGAGLTQRISVDSEGRQANGDSLSPSIAPDGYVVAFGSVASNLVPGDTNAVADTFVYDRRSGQATRVSVASSGAQGDAGSFMDPPALSADGRFVVLGSYAGNLVPGEDTNGPENPDVYVHDRQTGETSRVSVASDGTQGDNWSWKSDVSADGRYVTFSSWSSNLVPGDSNARIDVFVHDRTTGQTSRVSLSSSGAEGNDDSQYSAISADGSWVAFGSSASGLVPNDVNDSMDIFLHDRQTGQTTLASLASDGSQGDQASIHADISGNGRYVLFDSIATNLVGDDGNDQIDVFMHDRLSRTTTRVSVSADGVEGNDSSRMPAINHDGCSAAFTSNASNLVPGDTNNVEDAFVRTGACSAVQDVDLDVTYISRTPLYHAYCVEYTWDVLNQPGLSYLCPGTEGDRRWPEPGEIVTFTAHVVNKGTSASPPANFAWSIDGSTVAGGTLPALAPTQEATATYQWPWAHGLSADGQRALGDHTVRFAVDPANAIAETHESNNSLEDATRAMSFLVTLTPEMLAAYNIPVDPRYPRSAEDWLQKQIAAMNAAFANAIYPTTPQGSALRVRLDHIGAAAAPPEPDGLHDGGWFLRDDVRCDGCGYYDPVTDVDWGLVHELSHQVSIIDLYAVGVYAANVFVTGSQGGALANVGFGWPNPDIMGGGDISPYTDPHRYSSHTAAGSSTYAGYRNGYYGSYLYDIPLHTYLRILDSQGNPAPGVQVDLFQRTGPWDATGHMGVDNIPEMSGMTGADGLFLLPNRPANGGAVTANGHVLRDNPFGVVDIIGNQGLLLARLGKGGHEEYHWLDITQFNLAYWQGATTDYTLTISSHAPPAGAPAAPQLSAVRIAGARASLEWLPSPTPGVVGYRVYRATPPQYRYEAASGLLANTHFEEEFQGADGEHRLYAVVAVDGAGRESGFAELVYAPGLGLPVAVISAPGGDRLVLNNWNLYPLLGQRRDGRYTRRLVNVHYDLGRAHSLVLDGLGRLAVSGFGQFRDERAAVRVYDRDMRPLWGFGEEGPAPGQFAAPAGLAWWGPPCTVGGPYEPDGHTLLLLHLDGAANGAQGEIGAAAGVQFVDGLHGQGALIDDADTLTYAASGNIQHTQGSVEFWLRPEWNGNDGGNHTLFWWGEDEVYLHLRKDGISNLVFDYFYPGGSCGAPVNVAAMLAGSWHHVGFSWDEADIRLYLDGLLVARTVCGGVPHPAASTFFVGSLPHGQQSVEATIDELRISDIPRLGTTESCGRLLVADSANHRVQAFDSLGNLITAYGSFGAGAGRFNQPQGLMVDNSGRVIVADRGNNRLVLLGFDGQRFTYLRSLRAGFNAPMGVAGDRWGDLYVADSGNNRIVVLDPTGRVLAQYTEPNDGYSGPFNAPLGVAVEANGDIVVADTGNRRVVTIRDRHVRNSIYLPVILHQ